MSKRIENQDNLGSVLGYLIISKIQGIPEKWRAGRNWIKE